MALRNAILPILIVIAFFSIAGSSPGTEPRISPSFDLSTSVIHLLPKLTNCYGNIAGGLGFEVSKGCDNNDSTQYLGGNLNATEWVVFNLTTRSNVDHVAIPWKNYPGSGRIDVWTGSAWVAFKNYTYSGQNVNQTITLDRNYVTTKIRVYMTGPFASTTYAGFAEVWIYGDVPPADFTISASPSSLNLLSNVAGQTTISVSGQEGFTGYVNLSTVVSDSHAVVICVPIRMRVNVTPSDCTISADAPGHYTLTFTGTNATIGQTHSVSLALTATLAGVSPTLDANAWIFIFLIVALLAMLALSWWFDNLLFFTPAGVITFLLAFQAWNVTAAFAPTFAIVAVGVIELAIPLAYIMNPEVSKP